MPPLPTIPGVYRCVLPWQDLGSTVGVRPVNVLHVEAPTGLASDVATQFANVLGAHASLMFDVLYSGLTLQTIQVLKLDGFSAALDVTVPGSTSGGGGGGVLPQVCTVVSIKTGQRGSRGRGRVYVGPMGETQVNNGRVVTTSVTNMQSGWAAFASALQSGTPEMSLGIASYKHADFNPFTSIRIDPVVGTQRRRVEQIR